VVIRLDDALLEELELGSLPPPQKNALLAAIYQELEMRVGMRLASSFTTAQLDEFEVFIDSGDEEGALAWLTANYPDYREIVQEEWDDLQAEVRGSAGEILSAAVAYGAGDGRGGA
jgi:hypothetical protein